MFTKGKLMFLHAESPVHPGVGEGSGAIDLAIQRERITYWPIIQASAIKGAIREHFEEKNANNAELFVVFGPDPSKGGNPADNAGAVSFTDAKVLLFPVRSLRGSFAYITCPLAITRLRRDLETLRDATGYDLIDDDFKQVLGLENSQIQDGNIAVPDPSSSILAIDGNGTSDDNGSKQVVLEEYGLNVEQEARLNNLVNWLKARWSGDAPWVSLEKRIALVSDDMFRHFVEMSTEVITRIRIDDETGTVQKGALWTEEYLPRETLMYSLVLTCNPFKDKSKLPRSINSDDNIIKYITQNAATPNRIWLGGNVTVGKGALRLQFA